MAGCAVGVLLTSLSRISPKIQGKNREKIAWVQGRACGSVQARNFLPDSCSCMECSCVEPACGRRAGNGYCQGVGNRPDRLSATIYAGRCPSGRPGSRMQGTGSMPVSRAVGTRSCPGNNGGAPGEQDGTGKTGPPDRRRDLPDLICRTGTGFQGTGTSGGSRPISGMGAGPEHAPSREGFFCRWPCRTSRRFFSPPVSRKFRRDPFGGFPARFGRAFRFGGEGHFVSDDPSEKIS